MARGVRNLVARSFLLWVDAFGFQGGSLWHARRQVSAANFVELRFSFVWVAGMRSG